MSEGGDGAPGDAELGVEAALAKRESLEVAVDAVSALLSNVNYLIEEQAALAAGPRRAAAKSVTAAIGNAAFSLQHADTEGETRPTEPDYAPAPNAGIGG